MILGHLPVASPLTSAGPLQTTGPAGYIPQQILTAYGVNQISFAGITGDGTGQTIPLGPGHNHRHSMFYLAEGDYSLFNTCNSWISKALQAAGLPMKTALRAGGVMRQAQRYGRMIQVHAEAAEQ